MEAIAQILFYTSIISGGILFLLLLLSLVGGLDLDFDLDINADVDAGGLGLIKSGLTFISIGAYVGKLMLLASKNPTITILVSVVSGAIAVFIVSYFLKLLLKLQSNVNWEFHEAEGKSAKVYLRIPEDGTGIIKVNINGVTRELKAKTVDQKEVATGEEVLVLQVNEEIAEVTLYNHLNS